MVGNAGASGAILNHLKEHGSITNAEAATLYGCYRLSARIFEFRKAGYYISTIMEDGKTRYGRRCRYGRYVLAKGQRKNGSSRNKVSSKNV